MSDYLRDGEFVQFDANGKLIRKGRKEEILRDGQRVSVSMMLMDARSTPPPININSHRIHMASLSDADLRRKQVMQDIYELKLKERWLNRNGPPPARKTEYRPDPADASTYDRDAQQRRYEQKLKDRHANRLKGGM